MLEQVAVYAGRRNLEKTTALFDFFDKVPRIHGTVQPRVQRFEQSTRRIRVRRKARRQYLQWKAMQKKVRHTAERKSR